ncbi:hypothetical protein PS684_03166 [Pseudomonas fluorescens]|nr:hypothetical protein PS681_02829 [Pseudomonas fluorescens]VVN58411.1 hypothetical protein PS684_03166 [Pseudomonas fluorescens]
MKPFSVSEFRAKKTESTEKGRVSGRDFTLERVRRFQEADKSLQEACARLGIEKPIMTC